MKQTLESDATQQSRHWTDEQFSDYLLGLGADRDARVHLEMCAVCSAEVKKFGESVASFNKISLAWGEERSARSAQRPVEHVKSWVPTLTWALAAGLAMVIGIPAANHHRAVENARQAVQTAQLSAEVADVENTDAAIARDNQLMTAVAFELDRSDPLPAGLAAESSTSASVPLRSQ